MKKTKIFKRKEGKELAIVHYYGNDQVLYSYEFEPELDTILTSICDGLLNPSLFGSSRKEFNERYEYLYTIDHTVEDI